jgi:hypothetical protein
MSGLIKASVLALATFAATQNANAQINEWVNKANKALNSTGTTKGTGSSAAGSYTNTEAVNALKEALQIGTQNASGRLSVLNGYFGNQLIKILMPPEARQVETTLRSFGFGAQVDKMIVSMNRAAEDAATKAVPIFVNAITGMSIQDGISVVRGGQGAATNFLKTRTTQSLTDAFRPVIQSSLGKVDATRYWAEIMTIYNKLPITKNKINPDLTGYVTERALNGLFVTVADEENKIRANPMGQASSLLRKVFGGK